MLHPYEYVWDNAGMDLIYQQIGLDDDSLKVTVGNLALEVLDELHGYADNRPVSISSDSYDKHELSRAVELLKQKK